MKKTLLILILALGLCQQALAQNTWDFGLKGGIALNMMPGTTVVPYDRFRPNFGFQGGMFVAFHISDVVIAQLEAQYSRKGVSTINHATTDIGGSSLEYKRNIHYLQFPLMIGISSLANDRVKVMIGPELGVYLDNDIKANYWDPAFDNAYYELNRFNFAVAIQATYFITDSFGVEVKGDIGVTDTFKKETGDKGKNTAFQFGICWRFGY